MAPTFEEAPEVAPSADYPEVAHPQHQYHQQQYQNVPQQYQQYPPQTPVKPEGTPSPHPYGGAPPPPSTYGSQYNQTSPNPQYAGSTRRSPKGTICGCTILVFILSCIIALLSAAVIGLAAGTGVEANRANDANTKLAQLSSSISKATKTVTTTATPTSTAFADLDNNCSDDPGSVTGQTYNAFTFLGNATFTMMCNKDAANSPLMSLFTSDFNTCMDACASYTHYLPGLFGDSSNSTCTGVSFIPLWSTKSGALAGKAPGNCYLKPGLQNDDTITNPNIGTECHAGILNIPSS